MNGTVNLDGTNESVTINGSNDQGNSSWSGDTFGFNGTNENANLSDGTVNLDGNGQSVTIHGSDDAANSIWSNDTVGFDGTNEAANLSNAAVNLDGNGESVTVGGSSDIVSSIWSNDTVGLTRSNDTANLSSAQIYTNDTSAGSLTIQGSGDSETTVNGTTQGAAGLNSQTISDIDAIYNAVLDRDAAPGDLVSAQIVLADGGSLSSVMSAVANSAEAQADMASTYAAVGDAAQLDAQPQSTDQLLNVDDVQAQDSSVPTQTEFNAFADAMSTSYGAPIELFSVDPLSGQQTVLADTSITNLLAELPVLETLANGATLGLQLADGTQVQFASTARTATFLYSLAVQQGQATSFVTDNYNLDMQWLNTVDQPLLDEGLYWSERATAEASVYPERAVEDNVQADLALQIAAQAPSSRQDMSVTIHNAATGNPTQITVYADGDGSTIHDVAPTIGSIIESAISTVLNIAAVVFPTTGLPFLAAAVDGAEAGQAFTRGEDIQGILSLAQAVGMGATGFGATQTAQIISVATQGVGGVYGVVQGAETGDAGGIIAGALEAAAAGAAGIGTYSGGQTQAILQPISKVLTTAGILTTVANDFASGNVGQGLVDSLNLYLPILAQGYLAAQATISQGISAANISPTPDMLGIPQHIAFVGGFFDSTLNLLTGNSPMASAYNAFKAAYPNVDAQYFTWTDASGLANWVNQNGGQVTVIAHSYGADTAASVVASGVKVQTLVTLDPVSYLQPNFQQVAANSGQWLDYVATGGGLTLPNAIAAIGGAWNNATAGYATATVDVNVGHANIAGPGMMYRLLGI